MSPTLGDLYLTVIGFIDNSGVTDTIPVTGVLNTFATNLDETTSAVAGGVTLSRNVPEFTWAAPASPPSAYTYRVQISDSNGPVWNFKGARYSPGLPSTVTGAVFNSD